MGTSSKDEQQRVKTLLLDTITLLCKNGLAYNKSLRVQGLLGVTIDEDEVFVVHLNELMENMVGSVSSLGKRSGTEETDSPSPRKRKRRTSSENRNQNIPANPIDIFPQDDVAVKTEPADDIVYLDEAVPKAEAHIGGGVNIPGGDEGLDFAISSIESQGEHPNMDMSVSHQDSSNSSSAYVTGIVPNMSNMPHQPGDPQAGPSATQTLSSAQGQAPPWGGGPGPSQPRPRTSMPAASGTPQSVNHQLAVIGQVSGNSEDLRGNLLNPLRLNSNQNSQQPERSGEKTRYYKESWEQGRPWLKYSDGKMFCEWCIKFNENKLVALQTKNSFIKGGASSFKLYHVKKHESTVLHGQAAEFIYTHSQQS